MSIKMKSILLGDPEKIRRVFHRPTLDQLEKQAGLDTNRIYTLADLQDCPRDTDFIFSTWGMPALTEEQIKSVFPALKAVFYAAGTVQAFARPFLNCGVRIFSAWAANAVPVAEYTVSQILLANKGFFAACAWQSAGELEHAQIFRSYPGNYNCAVGILGAGMIGKMVIQALKTHDLSVLVFDPFLPDETADQMGVQKTDLQTIFSTCQTVSNHLANNPQTVGMLDYKLFASMPQNTVFLNTGRGAQVVESDLVRVLQERPDLTAVLDVTYPEPPAPGHAFYKLPNCFLTPHMAGSSGLEVGRMSRYMLEEFELFQSGKPTRYEVTKEMLQTMA